MIYIKLMLTAIFWGGTFIAGKLVTQHVHPVTAAFLRFAVASICLYLMIRKTEGRLPAIPKRQRISIVLLGVSGVFAYNILFFSGLELIEAGRASLIIATNPIFISLLSALIYKEPLNWVKAIGIGVSVTGALIVISKGHLGNMAMGGFGLGELLIFGCVWSWVAYSLIGKKVMQSMSPLVCVAYSAFVGTALLLAPALYYGLTATIGDVGLQAWGCLLYLGLFGTVMGFYWYYQGIEQIGAMKASVFINFVPISAIILSIAVLQEPLTISLIAGGGMVLIGVYLTNAADLMKQIARSRHKAINRRDKT